MKFKKYSYIVVFILMLVAGISRTYADSKKDCYYISDDNNFKVSLRIGYNIDSLGTAGFDDFTKAKIWKTGEGKAPLSTHNVENWFTSKDINGASVEGIYNDRKEASNQTNPTCPRYIIYTACPGWFLGIGTTDAVYATASSTKAQSAINASKECSYAAYASNYRNGSQITKEEFYGELNTDGLIQYDSSSGQYTCEDMNALFGSKDDPESIRYMINEILGAVRIIVPILIILLGMLDFGKAVLAGKQDNMKKAQSDFIKRLIAGVIVFLVPALVDIIMGLAEIVWQGTSYVPCDF